MPRDGAEDDHKPSLEEAQRYIVRKIKGSNREHEQRTRYTWQDIRQSLFCLYVSICVFAATAYGLADILKLPFFDDFLNREGYWSAYGLGALVGAAAAIYTLVFLNRLFRSG